MKQIVTFSDWLKESEYRDYHKAPSRGGYSAPLYDATALYPDDIYGPDAARLYGDRNPSIDRQTLSIIRAARNNPDLEVSIYRAIPSSVSEERSKIFPGDWVTINRSYAIMHGEGPLDGDYKIISMKVPAKHVYTHADSIHEWGYDPS